MEQGLELYVRENVVTKNVLNAIEYLSVLGELDKEPAIEEIKKQQEKKVYVENLKCDNALSSTPNYTRFCVSAGNKFPRNVTPIWSPCTKTGVGNYCNTHHGISLLNVIGKIFARVTLKRFQVLADRNYYIVIDIVSYLRQLEKR